MNQSLEQMTTRSKALKINNMNKDAIKKTRKRKKSSNIKNDLEISIKESPKRESFKAKKTSSESEKKKGSHRKLKFIQEPDAVDKSVLQKNLNTSSNVLKVGKELEDIVKNKNSISIKKKKLSKNNSSLLSNSQEMTPNQKLKWKVVLRDIKVSPNMITPKSTPPRINLTPHRSKKTPRKSPISLDSPKTHTKAVPRLLKSPRKLSLSTLSGLENTKKSNKKTHKKTLEKIKHDNSIELSPSNKDLSTSAVKKSQKSNKNVKTSVRKFSEQQRIVINPRKSKKSESPSKLRLSSPHQKYYKSMITIPNITVDLNDTKSSSIRSYKSKTLLSTKRRFLNSKIMTASQIRDLLAEPIVLLEKLSSKNISNIVTISGIKLNTPIKVKSSLINKNNSPKILTPTNSPIKLNESVNENSFRLRHSRAKDSNKISLRNKDSTLIQEKNKSIPLTSSTPREEKISLINIELIIDTPIVSVAKMSLNRSNRSNTQLSDIMDRSTIITDISKPSLMDISNDGQSYFSNSTIQRKLTRSQVSYDENNTILLKELESKKDDTYELEQPQTLNLRQMIRKRTSTDANLITPKMDKRTKVHFKNATSDTNSARKSIKWTASQSNTSHNAQRNSIMNSSHKLKQIKTPKFHRNSIISPFKRRSSLTVKNKANIRLNMTENTPKTLGSISKKTGKILFLDLLVYVFILNSFCIYNLLIYL